MAPPLNPGTRGLTTKANADALWARKHQTIVYLAIPFTATGEFTALRIKPFTGYTFNDSTSLAVVAISNWAGQDQRGHEDQVEASVHGDGMSSFN